MEKIFKYCTLVLGFLAMAVSFTACDDDETELTAPVDLSYEPTMGGAIIRFTAPRNNDLLYIKAAYKNSLGKDVYRTTSIYDNKIEIDGLADETKTYPVYVSAVDKWGGETSATVINVQPGRSFINVIKDNLEINPICGGLAVTWENPMGADAKADDITQNSVAKIVYVVVDYIDSEGVKRTRYLSSKQKMAKANIRNMFAGNYVVSYRVEDASGNKTAQSTPANVDVPAEEESLKFIERDDPVNGFVKEFIWTLVPRLTTLQPAWEYKNEAIFDGIIDSNTSNTQNYCGTDCDNSSVTYGSSIPWDTDQVDIVIDMHQVVSISRLKAWQRAYTYDNQPYSGASGQTSGISDDYFYYQPQNLKRFKLFGSMTLDEDGWFLIKDCDISSNSTAGTLPIYWTNPSYFDHTNVYMPTNESYQYAIDGHEWELEAMTDSVRYIRVRMVENWDLSKRNIAGMSELNLYGSILVSHEELAAREAQAANKPRRKK
ncbi:MAG: DUF4959 domain-containing protein [Prevotella sp.]|nr:DUF4959 domain-containing protein [Prevotella sp.]